MLKRIVAKRTDDFCIQDNVLVINVNGGILNLSPSDIKDIWFDQKTNTIIIAYKIDRVTLNLVSSEKYQKFCSEFVHFFSNDQFLVMKRQIIKRLISGSMTICLFAIYLYLYHFDRFSAVVYLLLGITFFSIATTYSHFKSINRFFK